MFCMHCGQALPPDAAFCPNCGRKCAGDGDLSGAPPVSAAEEETGARKVNSSMAFAVVMLILSLLCCNVFTFIPGLIAVLFALVEAPIEDMIAVRQVPTLVPSITK